MRFFYLVLFYMAYKFINNSGKHKFNGEFNYNGIDYEYSLYLPNFTAKETNEIVEKFGKRFQNGEVCLHVDEDTVRKYIKGGDVSAFVIVNEKDKDETASGTIQIYDWCSGIKPFRKENAFIWINDLCRILGPSGVKNKASPVSALMFFMEQLVAQNLKRTDIHLFVDTDDLKNKTGLMSLYKDKYGYIYNSEEDPNECPHNEAGTNLLVMRKPNLIEDPSISFAFLMKRSGGGKRKTRNRKYKRVRKNKTKKR